VERRSAFSRARLPPSICAAQSLLYCTENDVVAVMVDVPLVALLVTYGRRGTAFSRGKSTRCRSFPSSTTATSSCRAVAHVGRHRRPGNGHAVAPDGRGDRHDFVPLNGRR
jgi:hypothetical protein